MKKILDNVNLPEDVKKLTTKEKEQLATEIREMILKIVSENGGHLASNLGVVELTIALHSIFDMPKDKIIWDVGHQTYVHKILTGRKEKMLTLRKMDGIAGFPKTEESVYDNFDTGHSSTSISAALGIARARDLKKEKYNVIAVIGDGALTGGMALEALNDVGASNNNVIVILNDNEMSISKNVGGIPKLLGKIRTKKLYKNSNDCIRDFLEKIPLVGKKMSKIIKRIKKSIKQLLIPNMFFEDIGFSYLGPVDGHNIEELENIMRNSKKMQGPVLIHVITKKGKGYKIAEENPDNYHSTSAFNIENGKTKNEKKDDYSKIFGKKLVDLAEKNNKIVAITAAMKDGTGLSNFARQFPSRFFDTGIAEQHAICMAAGMAINGLIPVVPIYSSFYQRAYDQVIHDICIQNLGVVMCVDRAGIVGNDGETHQGILDLSFFNIVPNLNIMAPKDFKELEDMLEFAVHLRKPIVIRYPRGGEADIKFNKHEKIELGKSEILQEGTDVTIIAIGKMVSRAYEVSNELKKENINAEVINVRFLKPLDEKTIVESIKKNKKIVTIEDNILQGGLATSLNELIVRNNIKNVKIKNFGYPNIFVKHGSVKEIEKKYGLDIKNIVEETKELLNNGEDEKKEK
jgi:1-deoxy-D-xylulose-5-phosphate synthase